MEGYAPRDRLPDDFDLEQAKLWMAKAGYPNGNGLAPFHFYGGMDSVSRQEAEFLEKLLSEIGVRIVFEPTTEPAFMEKMSSGTMDMFIGGWGGAIRSPAADRGQ